MVSGRTWDGREGYIAIDQLDLLASECICKLDLLHEFKRTNY